jgi:hypothetical protein
MGLAACVVEGELCEEGAAAGEACCAWSGTAVCTMAKSKQHFHTMCLIVFVRSAACDIAARRRSNSTTADSHAAFCQSETDTTNSIGLQVPRGGWPGIIRVATDFDDVRSIDIVDSNF